MAALPSGVPPLIESFFDPVTWTISTLVLDRASGQCALVDSVLDYDPKSGRTGHASADLLVARVRELGAQLQWILETHVHADHLSAADYLKQQLGGQVGIGAQITQVQQVFGQLFNTGADGPCDGRPFDRLFADGEVFHIGQLPVQALHTPGHTPACLSYLLGSAGAAGPAAAGAGAPPLTALVGDTL
jgi:glyoxylase-like metal-dependent hydrolase (beta-lactamase superfamily II)